MRLTKEKLIAAAHEAAKYLPAASADIMKELANRLDVTSVALSESLEQRKAVAVENNFLLGMAARELSTSWLHNRAMLGMQAALLCLSQGDIKAARDWLEGTTDEAVAEMPDDMTPDGLQLWYDSYMRSSDGKNGFLTREESHHELSKRIPATSSAIAELRAEAKSEVLDEMAATYRGWASEDDCSCNMKCSYNLTAERAENYAAYVRRQLRESKEEATSNGR